MDQRSIDMAKKFEVCISTVVDENYKDYVPMFIWVCKEAYPEYDVKVFTTYESTLPHTVPMFQDHPYDGYNTIALRFVVPPEEYKDYKYVYVTDIDMILVRETPKLHIFHLDEMNVTGLNYSNSLRNKKHWKGTESLTGLHFASFEWFSQMNNVIIKYEKFLRENKVIREYDGHMLYCMNRDAGVSQPPKFPLVMRHHGIHLGNFRLFERGAKINKRVDRRKCHHWRRYLQKDKFKAICEEASKNPLINKQVDLLNKHCEELLGL